MFFILRSVCMILLYIFFFFFFNDTATTEIYTLSLHDALPIFDGDRQRLNIAHECIDRHAGRANPAAIVVRADGSSGTLSFRDIAEDSARFAHWLAAEGVQPG